MLSSLFPDFPDDARLWLFAFERPLTEGEAAGLAQGFEAFKPHWKTHGHSIDSDWTLLESQVLAVVERTMGTNPSGCSIDAMLRQTQKIGRSLEVGLLDAQQVLVRLGGALRVIPKTALAEALECGELRGDTPVIDLGLLELGHLRGGRLERPLHGTWMGRRYHALLEEAPTAH